MEVATKKRKQKEQSEYKNTELGMLPTDWNVYKLKECLKESLQYGIGAAACEYNVNLPRYLRITDISEEGNLIEENKASVNVNDYSNYVLEKNDIVLARTGASVGKSFHFNSDDFSNEMVFAGFLIKASTDENKLNPLYLKYFLQTDPYWTWVKKNSMRSGQPGINSQEYSRLKIPLPPTLEEQRAIADALNDVDELITSLDELIEKKKKIKKGAMQELLTGKTRLPGFSGEWEGKKLGEVANCLDDLRIPLNQEERDEMTGNIPYCGANGILDYVDDYVVDDDIILMAEDGGHFDEYQFRPIAYRFKGKCWVNNHAHILQAKDDFSQGYLFYSLVHKDITDFITGGTRAKLNKGNMVKIPLNAPKDLEEQNAIAEVLSNMDEEIQSLQEKSDKYKKIKQGMMQELLTGKTRLV